MDAVNWSDGAGSRGRDCQRFWGQRAVLGGPGCCLDLQFGGLPRLQHPTRYLNLMQNETATFDHADHLGRASCRRNRPSIINLTTTFDIERGKWGQNLSFIADLKCLNDVIVCK